MAVEEAANAVKGGVSTAWNAMSSTAKTLTLPALFMTGVGLVGMPPEAIAGVTEPVIQGTLTTAETISELLGGAAAAGGGTAAAATTAATTTAAVTPPATGLVAGGAPIFTPGS